MLFDKKILIRKLSRASGGGFSTGKRVRGMIGRVWTYHDNQHYCTYLTTYVNILLDDYFLNHAIEN